LLKDKSYMYIILILYTFCKIMIRFKDRNILETIKEIRLTGLVIACVGTAF